MVSLEFILYLTFSYLISCGRGIFTREFEFSLASKAPPPRRTGSHFNAWIVLPYVELRQRDVSAWYNKLKDIGLTDTEL